MPFGLLDSVHVTAWAALCKCEVWYSSTTSRYFEYKQTTTRRSLGRLLYKFVFQKEKNPSLEPTQSMYTHIFFSFFACVSTTHQMKYRCGPSDVIRLNAPTCCLEVGSFRWHTIHYIRQCVVSMNDIYVCVVSMVWRLVVIVRNSKHQTPVMAEKNSMVYYHFKIVELSLLFDKYNNMFPVLVHHSWSLILLIFYLSICRWYKPLCPSCDEEIIDFGVGPYSEQTYVGFVTTHTIFWRVLAVY